MTLKQLMLGQTDVGHGNAIQTAIVDANDDVIERAAELICRTRVVDHHSVAINEQTQLSGLADRRSVQSNAEVTCDVDRHLERGRLGQNTADSSSKNFGGTATEPGRYSTTTNVTWLTD